MKTVTLQEFDALYTQWELHGELLSMDGYGGQIGRHYVAGDLRLASLRFHPSPAALRLWNFLMTEEERLHRSRKNGKKIVGTLKDLGTVPVMVCAFDNMVPFYPDGAWWLPCFKAQTTDLYTRAAQLGIGEGFCPVRAMLGAFESQAHFPIPDLLISSTGAVCDDFSAVVQRLAECGHEVMFWEMPHARGAEPGEHAISLPSQHSVSSLTLSVVIHEFERILKTLEACAGYTIGISQLRDAIRQANTIRDVLHKLRQTVYTAVYPPLSALEMMIAEMLAIHYCSDRNECLPVLQSLLDEAENKLQNSTKTSTPPARFFWINPTADLMAMNLLESAQAMLCGTDLMFTHALDPIPEDCPPLEALAMTALSDPMTGPLAVRAARICRDIQQFGAEAVVLSRIPGGSHCAYEYDVIRTHVTEGLGLPMLELEFDSVCDGAAAAILTRLQALAETVISSRP